MSDIDLRSCWLIPDVDTVDQLKETTILAFIKCIETHDVADNEISNLSTRVSTYICFVRRMPLLRWRRVMCIKWTGRTHIGPVGKQMKGVAVHSLQQCVGDAVFCFFLARRFQGLLTIYLRVHTLSGGVKFPSSCGKIPCQEPHLMRHMCEREKCVGRCEGKKRKKISLHILHTSSVSEMTLFIFLLQR